MKLWREWNDEENMRSRSTVYIDKTNKQNLSCGEMTLNPFAVQKEKGFCKLESCDLLNYIITWYLTDILNVTLQILTFFTLQRPWSFIMLSLFCNVQKMWPNDVFYPQHLNMRILCKLRRDIREPRKAFCIRYFTLVT